MKNSILKLLRPDRVVSAFAILFVLVFVFTPVSASTCHPGFVVNYPSSYSIQFTQPSVSGTFITSPALSQNSVVQFSQPSFSRSTPDFLIGGKSYSHLSIFGW
jgi:hypothetical protein